MTTLPDILEAFLVEPYGWFTDLLDASGMEPFYLSFIFIFLVGKYILKPLFGSSRGSDKARKNAGSSGGSIDG